MLTPLRHVLVPTDFSATADAALERAIELALRDASHVTLLHVIDPAFPTTPGVLPMPTVDLERTLEVHARKRLAERALRCSTEGLSVTSAVVFGDPATAILETAKQTQPDVMVLGAHGAGIVARLLLGSTAERVARRSPCPVLLIPPARPAIAKSA